VIKRSDCKWAELNCTGCMGWYAGTGYCLSDVVAYCKFVECNMLLYKLKREMGAINLNCNVAN
jgi:hypothetical protein